VRAQVVRGQYTAGWVGDKQVVGYRQEEEVDGKSKLETFVALKLEVQNWRWADVPFYLRTGKRMPRRATEIAIQFKLPPLMLFGESATPPEPNLLAMRIQPDEGIMLRFAAKVPELGLDVRSVNMDFTYGCRSPTTRLRRTRRCCWTRCWATRRCSPRRRGRGGVGIVTPRTTCGRWDRIDATCYYELARGA
jgi:glucose-6-phosphate 1-dehydrogenase